MARLGKRKFGGKECWCVFWYDYSKGSLKIREVRCSAKYADNERLRNKLLRKYQDKEDVIKREIRLHGIKKIQQTDFIIDDLIKIYLEHKNKLVELHSIGKPGITKESFYLTTLHLRSFQDFCIINKITFTSQLNSEMINNFRRFIELKKFATPTKNKVFSVVKTFFNFYRYDEIPKFFNVDVINHLLRNFRCDDNFAFHFTTEQLQKILKEALIHDSEKCKITRESKKDNSQPDKAKFVPVLQHILLFMLTGMRLSEGLTLRWDDVDLKSGIIRVKSNKTHKIRIIPLVNDMHANIAPTFLEILKCWKAKSKSDYVLPHDNSTKPYNLQKPLIVFKNSVKMPDLTFQNLRKNFESYLISFGVPSSIDAIWLGHSPAVAEKHYISYVFSRLQGKTIEQAMQIDKILDKILIFYRTDKYLIA